MNLKVNNCGECPFVNYGKNKCQFYCAHPAQKVGIIKYSEVHETIDIFCPLKTSPITIKLNEDDKH